MKILVINGVNLNMLGVREPELYGKQDYKALVKYVKEKYYGIVINPGAFTHTSVAILDALKAVNVKTVEVHLTDIKSREEFRNFSYISLFATKTICGKGFDGYKEALEFFAK